MTTTAEVSTVRDYVRSMPAEESTYVKAEAVVNVAVLTFPGPDPSTGTDEHGDKLYPIGFLKVATIMATLGLQSIEDAKQNKADAYKVNAS